MNDAGVSSHFLEGSGPTTMHSGARLLSFIVLIGAAGLSTGCNKQGEGDRCDPLSGGTPAGTNDCQPPLTCQAIANVTRCCPPAGIAATQAVCSVPQGSLYAPSAVPDGGSNGSDAEVEASGDDAADATVDAASGDDANADDAAASDGQAASDDDGGGIDAEGGVMDVGLADVGTDE